MTRPPSAEGASGDAAKKEIEFIPLEYCVYPLISKNEGIDEWKMTVVCTLG